ncbi:pseudaminic acid synthase [Flavobacteriaceae bacterium]|nr:pseudaminic acid synthase [Flavobacteriaceae bacterium]
MKFNFKKVFVVAELSANHGGKIEIAIDSIKAAKRAGADAVKLQTYTPNTMTINSNKSDFIVSGGSIWDGQTFFDLYKLAYTPWEWHKKLFEVAKKEGLECFSTPFDKTAVDFLEELNNPIYKIASFEITDIPLIEYVASKGKPIILSTGIAKYEDIELAIETIRNQGNNQIALLKCTSSYPAPLNEANLTMISDFKEKFNVIIGLSDHTMGNVAATVATALGARIIEKHFIIDKSIGGPDASFSLDTQEFAKMVKAVREAELSIGEVDYNLTQKQKSGKMFSRSLYIVKDVRIGDTIKEENIRSIRPGFGGHPKYLKKLIGEKFKNNFFKGERFTQEEIRKYLK